MAYTNVKLRAKLSEVFDLIGEEEVAEEALKTELNLFLDSLLDVDYFGTEGQNDPRQDWRNNEISYR